MLKPQMWFGTKDFMQWIPAPLSGAEMSPEGWDAGGTLLSGGGYQLHSWGSHKVYTFKWSEASGIPEAQMMKSYNDGTYGRGLLYFIDPLTYSHNVLPARWADPSVAAADDSRSLVYGVTPTTVATTNFRKNLLPVRTARYDLRSARIGFPGESDSLYIPIPEGHSLALGAIYDATSEAGVYYAVDDGGPLTTQVRLVPLPQTTDVMTNTVVSGVRGVYLFAGRYTASMGSVNITAMTARIFRNGEANPVDGPWIGGMGHSGVRFASRPTWTGTSGTDGGQVGYAASFREVGSWAYL